MVKWDHSTLAALHSEFESRFLHSLCESRGLTDGQPVIKLVGQWADSANGNTLRLHRRIRSSNLRLSTNLNGVDVGYFDKTKIITAFVVPSN